MAAFYCKSLDEFLEQSNAEIRDELVENSRFFHQLKTQSDSWATLISILKNSLSNFGSLNNTCGILLEYPIPRRSKRIDAVLIIQDLIIVIEFKDGKTEYLNADRSQLEDYCLDLRDFHYDSKDRIIIPILLSTHASQLKNEFNDSLDNVKPILFANENSLGDVLYQAYNTWHKNELVIEPHIWNKSKYFPTPTIIEAAQALYAGQDVKEISRHHAGVENLNNTTNAVLNAIQQAKATNSKIICFITGVPGAGKTLAGLNIVHNRLYNNIEEGLGVFLSGNSPLVKVLSEALARDFSKRNTVPKPEARRKVSTFIHNVHQFIDEYYA